MNSSGPWLGNLEELVFLEMDDLVTGMMSIYAGTVDQLTTGNLKQ